MEGLIEIMGLSVFSIALRNLRRRLLRTAVIFLGMSALSGTLFTLTIIYLSVGRSIEKSSARLGADAMAVPLKWQEETNDILLSGLPSAFYMKADVEDALEKINGVSEAASQLFIISAPLSCCSVSDTMLIGFEPEDDFTVSPWLRQTLKKMPSDNEVIAGSNILAEPGGRLRFYGKEFLVAGKLEPTGMTFIDSSVFIPMAGARQMIVESGQKALKTLQIKPDEISTVLLRFTEKAVAEEVAVRIEYSMPDLKVVLSGDIMRQARHNLVVPIKSIITAGIIEWATSLLLIGIIYSLSIGERKREMGLLRAIGAKQKDVRSIFLYEILLLSGGGGIAGITAGIVFVLSFENLIRVFFNVPFLFPSGAQLFLIGGVILLFTVTSALSVTFYPAIKVSGESPLEVIKGA